MTAQLMDIAMPTSSRIQGSKYPFEAMTVGGPALVESEVVNAQKVASRLQSALAAARKRNPELKDRKFRVRVFKQSDGTDAVGCWRTE